ncbi:hypothetical protein TH61_04290 [Rufibacter sp. DG15C]|uniref:tetratricopeptide repeat protein n=1 Tax=Rufibacter sp. DG15C TaxID=1379909 RepID=UPI00078E37B9|nr:hypothetical protein [Rufibacter sp. DG15C]AMM50551.1 hypothetical protein TH61_04290 [Rufibacter sp. DG15C]
MIEEEAHYTTFEAYRRQQLPAQERLAFEQELAQDPALRLLYQEYLNWVEAIKAAKRQDLKAKLQTWDAQMPPVAQKRNPIWKIAASIVLLITLSGSFFLYKASHTPAFTDQNYVEEPGLPVLMGSSQSWSPSMNAYRAGNYALALQQMPTQAGADTTAFFKGLFSLRQQQPAVALTHFQDAALAKSAYAEKASYYRAYAFWQADRKQEAKAVFEEIARNPKHTFQKEAAQVLASGSL